MRSILLSAFAIIFSIIIVNAQSLVLTYEGEQLENNATITVEGNHNLDEIVAELDVTNTSSSDIGVLVQKTNMSMLPNTSTYFCWGLCYDTSTVLSPYPLTIAAGVTNDFDFSGHYSPEGNVGESTVKFEFFDEENTSDITAVIIAFNGVLTGTSEQEYANKFNIFPVPANEMINISSSINEKAGFKLFNANGAEVGSIESLNPVNQVDVSSLANGVYFYKISNGDLLMKSGRIVVKH